MQHNMSLIITANFGRSISHFKKKSVIYFHKYTYSFMECTSYCQILMKIELS